MKSISLIILLIALNLNAQIKVIETKESGFGLDWQLREYTSEDQTEVYIVIPYFDTSNDSLNIKEIQILSQESLNEFCKLLNLKGNEINNPGSTEMFKNISLMTICSFTEHNHKGSDFIWIKALDGSTSLIEKDKAIKLASDLLAYKSKLTFKNETFY